VALVVASSSPSVNRWPFIPDFFAATERSPLFMPEVGMAPKPAG
jgi:hypothetical protein